MSDDRAGEESRLVATLRDLLAIHVDDLADALHRAARLVAEALGADKVDVFLLLRDPERDALVALGVNDTPMARRERELGLDHLPLAEAGYLADVYQTGTPYWSGQVGARELGAVSQRLGVRSGIAVPLDVAGSRRGVLAAASARPDAFAETDLRWLAVMAHLTALLIERAQMAQARAEAARLAALDRVRAEFLATVSHTLQTPLTAVRAAIVLLEASAPDRLMPDERALLETARHNVERLRLHINDLLIANQVESGTLELEPVPLDLRVIATQAVERVRPLLREKGQAIEVDLPEPLPVVGDPLRLEQALVNLLSNAQRHTPVGTHVTVSGHSAGREARLVVRDTGPGIPASELEAIFVRAYRGHAGAGGAGLGLAIARRLVELQGGRLWADSPPGGGAAFHLALPRRPARARRKRRDV